MDRRLYSRAVWPQPARMRWLRHMLSEWRRQRALLADVKQFHADSRAHLAALSPEQAARERAALFGAQPGDRARLVSVKGIRVADHAPARGPATP